MVSNCITIAKQIVPEKKSFLGTFQAKRILLISFAANLNDIFKGPFSLFRDKKAVSDRNGYTLKKLLISLIIPLAIKNHMKQSDLGKSVNPNV